jgi:hypothetical protein
MIWEKRATRRHYRRTERRERSCYCGRDLLGSGYSPQVDAPKTLEGFAVYASRAEPNKPNVKIDATPLIEFGRADDGTLRRRGGAQRLRLRLPRRMLGAYVAWH